jgi:hypothetical protein
MYNAFCVVISQYELYNPEYPNEKCVVAHPHPLDWNFVPGSIVSCKVGSFLVQTDYQMEQITYGTSPAVLNICHLSMCQQHSTIGKSYFAGENR